MACPVCTPSLQPIGSRRHALHFAVRFGDGSHCVCKNGVQIHDCYEADIKLGTAWRYQWPPRLCDCGQGGIAYMDHGDFTVSLTVLPAVQAMTGP